MELHKIPKSIHGIEIDPFLFAYIICALWSTNDESDEAGGEPLDKNYSIENLSADALKQMKSDCDKFQQENAELLSKAIYPQHTFDEGTYTDLEMAGHDFWLTRNGHGSNFLDSDLGGVERDLYEAASKYKEVNLYVEDDDQIYMI